MKVFGYGFWLFAFFVGPALAQTETIGWQEAVARLAAERTRAETCVSLLKKHGDEAAISQGQLAYGEAKADMDAVLAGLVVALAENEEPESLPDLEAKLQRGVKQREAFCEEATRLVPGTEGEKSLIIDLLGEVVGPLIEAASTIYLDYREEDRLTRKTIQTQLEATTWTAFDEIPT